MKDILAAKRVLARAGANPSADFTIQGSPSFFRKSPELGQTLDDLEQAGVSWLLAGVPATHSEPLENAAVR